MEAKVKSIVKSIKKGLPGRVPFYKDKRVIVGLTVVGSASAVLLLARRGVIRLPGITPKEEVPVEEETYSSPSFQVNPENPREITVDISPTVNDLVSDIDQTVEKEAKSTIESLDETPSAVDYEDLTEEAKEIARDPDVSETLESYSNGIKEAGEDIYKASLYSSGADALYNESSIWEDTAKDLEDAYEEEKEKYDQVKKEEEELSKYPIETQNTISYPVPSEEDPSKYKIVTKQKTVKTQKEAHENTKRVRKGLKTKEKMILGTMTSLYAASFIARNTFRAFSNGARKFAHKSYSFLSSAGRKLRGAKTSLINKFKRLKRVKPFLGKVKSKTFTHLAVAKAKVGHLALCFKNKTKNAWRRLSGAVKDKLRSGSKFRSRVRDSLRKVKTKIVSGTSSLGRKIYRGIKKTPKSIIGGLKKAGGKLKEKFSGVKEILKKKTSSVAQKIKQTRTYQRVTSFFRKIGGILSEEDVIGVVEIGDKEILVIWLSLDPEVYL